MSSDASATEPLPVSPVDRQAEPGHLKGLPTGDPAAGMRLADLDIGEEARVGEYPDENDYCQRLIRMGLIPGTIIRLERRAPLGDPVEIRFRGYALVLRPTEADCLRLEQP